MAVNVLTNIGVTQITPRFLAAFLQLRRTTLRFVMCVRFGPHGTTQLPLDGFLSIFRKSFEKIQI